MAIDTGSGVLLPSFPVDVVEMATGAVISMVFSPLLFGVPNTPMYCANLRNGTFVDAPIGYIVCTAYRSLYCRISYGNVDAFIQFISTLYDGSATVSFPNIIPMMPDAE